jgi:hypothetical protein
LHHRAHSAARKGRNHGCPQALLVLVLVALATADFSRGFQATESPEFLVASATTEFDGRPADETDFDIK